MDAVWLATDSAGKVAVFITAGQAPVPDAFLAVDAAFAAVDVLDDLTPVTNAVGIGGAKACEDDLRLASLGFYVFDWWNVHRTDVLNHAYDLMAQPEQPLLGETLPPILRSAACRVVFAGDFADMLTCDVCREFSCVAAPFCP